MIYWVLSLYITCFFYLCFSQWLCKQRFLSGIFLLLDNLFCSCNYKIYSFFMIFLLLDKAYSDGMAEAIHRWSSHHRCTNQALTEGECSVALGVRKCSLSLFSASVDPDNLQPSSRKLKCQLGTLLSPLSSGDSDNFKLVHWSS